MGLVQGGLNGRRFRITTPLPEGFRDRYLQGVREFAFQPRLDATDKEPTVGWVDIFEAANTKFELNTFLFDRYLALALRSDKKSVNGRYAKIALYEREQQVMEERGLEKLSKDDKEALKEAVEAELFARALPSVSTTDVVWDTVSGQVIVFGTSDSQVEIVVENFEATFDVRLRPERMADWLHDKLAWDEIVERTERFLPGARGGAGTEGFVDGHRMDDPLENVELPLAADFITWLWLQSEASDGLFRVIDGDGVKTAVEEVEDGWNDVTETLKRADLTLWLENRLKLQDVDPHDDVPETTILLGAAPTTSDNARRDLHTGKRPVQACLGMKLEDLEIAMELAATDAGLSIAGLKLPFEVKKGTDEKIFERMMLLDLVHTTLKQLFTQFFLARTSPAWEERVNAWITNEILAAK
ncbi:MAG: recombination-associated protein RdgC [Myxococcales bacterium]|nr:recombination-associated protein RdgC [Myxococcales bacterium]MCB9669435.1 recombination-associated protein RdgC [Alphaproteobacteria bacterium]MCB9692182.1 recombination-associated protein RdgC [Alphaproteobacteria bacterium]